MVAIKDLMSLFDTGLKDVFEKRGFDATKDRAALVARLNKTKDKFLATEPQRGRKDFTVSNGVVMWNPVTPGGGPLFAGGVVYVPSERFIEAIDRTVTLTNAGKLDDRLEKAHEEEGAEAATQPRERKARKPRDPNAPARAGWSDERKARQAETYRLRRERKAAEAGA